jgi:hypothetical protein
MFTESSECGAFVVMFAWATVYQLPLTQTLCDQQLRAIRKHICLTLLNATLHCRFLPKVRFHRIGFVFLSQRPEHEFRFSVNVYIRQTSYSIWQKDGTLSEQSFAWGTAGKQIIRHHEILSC